MIHDYSDSVLKAANKMASEDLDQFGAEMVLASSGEAPRQTGNLAETITHETDDLVCSVFTESGKKDGGEGYGYWVHEGTSRMDANPFLRRGFEMTKAARSG